MNRMRTSKGSAILEDCWYVLIVALLGGSNLGKKIRRCRIYKLCLIILSVVSSSHFQLHFIRSKNRRSGRDLLTQGSGMRCSIYNVKKA